MAHPPLRQRPPNKRLPLHRLLLHRLLRLRKPRNRPPSRSLHWSPNLLANPRRQLRKRMGIRKRELFRHWFARWRASTESIFAR